MNNGEAHFFVVKDDDGYHVENSYGGRFPIGPISKERAVMIVKKYNKRWRQDSLPENWE